jgi:hypothetical protein
MASSEDLVIFADVALCRSDIADASMAVRVVGPIHEVRLPGTRLLKIGKALRGKLRPNPMFYFVPNIRRSDSAIVALISAAHVFFLYRDCLTSKRGMVSWVKRNDTEL